MSNYTKEDIISICKDLYMDIDKCIDDIVKSRLKKDIALENKAHFEMEKIIVGTKQDLTVIIDYLKNLQEN